MRKFVDQSIIRQTNLAPAATRGLFLPDGSQYQRNDDSVDRKSEPTIVTGSLALDRDLKSRCRLVETIRDPADPARLAFLDWRDGEYTVVPQVEHLGTIYVPPTEGAGLVSHLTLPSGIRPCGELHELLADLRKTIKEFVEISDRDILLIQSVVLATWFPDLFDSVPYLWLVGPPGSAKTTLLRLLSCLCRRALLVGDIRAAALYQLVDRVDCTLLIDELELSGSRSDLDILRLLRTGSTPGIPAVRNGQLYSTSAFKVIASRQLPDDTALVNRAVVISMLPSLMELRPLSAEEMRRIAEQFQPRLLMFRLSRRSAVRDFRMQACNLDDMTPRARQLARVLLAPLQGDEQAQADLINVLRECDRETQLERFLEPEWLVEEVLFAIDHDRLPNGGRRFAILVGGVAGDVNNMLERRGEDLRFSPRRVGAVLKSLGIKTRRIGNLGRGLMFTPGFHRKVHEVARQLGMDRTHIASIPGVENGYGGAPCALCEEFGLTAGLRFVEPTLRQPRRSSTAPHIPLFDRKIHDERPAKGCDDRVSAEKG
jgi:hypothetical protein